MDRARQSHRFDYHSPTCNSPTGKTRAGHIWGELVPYGLHDLASTIESSAHGVAAANENTCSRCRRVMIEGRKLPAGAYGLHFLADKDEWTVIFSKNSTSWGSFTYDPAEDALRVKVKPEKSAYHEWLDYEFTDRKSDRARLELQWENLAVPIAITVPNIHDLYVAQMEKDLRGSHWFTWTNWNAAALYCLTTRPISAGAPLPSRP